MVLSLQSSKWESEERTICQKTKGGHVPAFPVKAVDTVAAGDAFNAGLAVALAEGHGLEDAVRRGAAAGAVAVTRVGAQDAMPREG